MSGWPDPARPGVPLNPERDGWHWIERYLGVPSCFWWCAGWHTNGASGWGRFNEQDRLKKWRYLGPCLPPAEVAAREAAVFTRGADAMRERAALVAAMEAVAASCQAEEAPPDSPSMCWQQGRSDGSARVRDAIRALPVPEDKA